MKFSGSLAFAIFAALLLFASLAGAQTNPCTDAVSGVVVTPTRVAADLPDHNATELDGSLVVASYDLGVFLATGATPNSAPISTSVVPRANVAAVTGVANCYLVTPLPTELLGVPKGTAHVIGLRARRASDASTTPWVLSNPFGFPAALTPPRAVRVLR